jgi:hypothetical protein
MSYEQSQSEATQALTRERAVAFYSVKRDSWCVKTAGHLCEGFEKQSARAWRDILNSIIPK